MVCVGMGGVARWCGGAGGGWGHDDEGEGVGATAAAANWMEIKVEERKFFFF